MATTSVAIASRGAAYFAASRSTMSATLCAPSQSFSTSTAISSGALPGYDVTTWYGVFVPAGTPKDIIAKLNRTLNEALAEPEVREKLTKEGQLMLEKK